MAVNDPIGDLIARIRNAQMRGKSKVTTPASKLRVTRPRRAQAGRLHPRLRQGRACRRPREIEIELKYFDGAPVIHEIERVSKPGRRVYVVGRQSAAHQQRPRYRHSVDAQGRHGGSRRARANVAAK